MTEYIKNPLSGKLRGVTYEDGKIIDVHIRDTDDVVKVFVPVRHGRWDDSGRYTFPSGSPAVRCTECGCALTVSEFHLNNWNYCPVCGAKMDLDEDTYEM